MNGDALTGLEFLEGDSKEIAPFDVVHPSAPWPAELVFDLALGMDDLLALQERYNLSSAQWDALVSHPNFVRAVADKTREITDSGVGFRAKAKLQAEMYLLEVDRIATGQSIDPKVRLEAIKSVVQWADLLPEKASGAPVTNVPQVNVQINLN